MPTTNERFTSGLRFDTIIIIRIKLFCSSLYTYYSSIQGSLLPFISHCFGITRRKYINITIICRPNSLVILRLHSPTSIADFISLNNLFSSQRFIIKNSDPAFVGILRPLQFAFFITAAVGTTVFCLYQIIIARKYPFSPVSGRSILT